MTCILWLDDSLPMQKRRASIYVWIVNTTDTTDIRVSAESLLLFSEFNWKFHSKLANFRAKNLLLKKPPPDPSTTKQTHGLRIDLYFVTKITHTTSKRMVHTLLLRKIQKNCRFLIEKNHHFLYKISCFSNAFFGTLLNEKYAFS